MLSDSVCTCKGKHSNHRCARLGYTTQSRILRSYSHIHNLDLSEIACNRILKAIGTWRQQLRAFVAQSDQTMSSTVRYKFCKCMNIANFRSDNCTCRFLMLNWALKLPHIGIADSCATPAGTAGTILIWHHDDSHLLHTFSAIHEPRKCLCTLHLIL